MIEKYPTCHISGIENNTTTFDKNDFSHIYFLIKNDQIMYVGKSKNGVATRNENHYKNKPKFDKIIFYSVNLNELDKEEERMILKFAPPWNLCSIGNEARRLKGIHSIKKKRKKIKKKVPIIWREGKRDLSSKDICNLCDMFICDLYLFEEKVAEVRGCKLIPIEEKITGERPEYNQICPFCNNKTGHWPDMLQESKPFGRPYHNEQIHICFSCKKIWARRFEKQETGKDYGLKYEWVHTGSYEVIPKKPLVDHRYERITR